MKPLAIILLIILFGFKSYSQVFAPDNAVWHYTYNPSPAITFGYDKISVTGDTIIESKNCKILNIATIGYNYWTQTYYNYSNNPEFIYCDSNKVYWYHTDQFYILYNFDAISGDTWYLPNIDDYGNGIGKIKVDSTDISIFNSDTLKIIYQHTDSGNVAFGDFTIIEKLGNISFMFPFTSDITGSEYPGPLRCYSDDLFGEYQNPTTPQCEYITQSHLVENTNFDFNLYPNPSSDIVNIEIRSTDKIKLFKIEFYDLSGRVLLSKMVDTNKATTISINKLESGLYLYRITNNKTLLINGHFIKS